MFDPSAWTPGSGWDVLILAAWVLWPPIKRRLTR